jgi:hypothetical protein
MKKLFVAMLLFTVVFVGDAQVVKTMAGGSSSQGEVSQTVVQVAQTAQTVAQAAQTVAQAAQTVAQAAQTVSQAAQTVSQAAGKPGFFAKFAIFGIGAVCGGILLGVPVLNYRLCIIRR